MNSKALENFLIPEVAEEGIISNFKAKREQKKAEREEKKMLAREHDDKCKQLLPKVPSYPVPLSSVGNSYGINRNQTLGELNNSFTNNNIFGGGFGFPNNSFTMNGKNGWICPSCKNFNYESNYYYYLYI